MHIASSHCIYKCARIGVTYVRTLWDAVLAGIHGTTTTPVSFPFDRSDQYVQVYRRLVNVRNFRCVSGLHLTACDESIFSIRNLILFIIYI